MPPRAQATVSVAARDDPGPSRENGRGEDGALQFPGVGHRVDAPLTHWQYFHITEFRYCYF